MPSIRYVNQSAPFWDFVANLENQGSNHPFFSANSRNAGEESSGEDNPWGAWAGPHQGWHHGPPRGPHHHPRGPPPPPGPHEHPPPPPSGHEGPPPPPEHEDPPAPPGPDGPPHHDGPPHERHGHGHGHGHGRWGPGRRGRGFGGRGGRCGGLGGSAMSGPFNFGALAEMFQDQLFGQNDENERPKATGESTEDFKPDVDVFDTEDSYVVHISLPGAKKEDVGVNWDAEKSELSIAGVIYRPGDEEFLKTLALDERKVGAFERKVRLGSRANPAQIDVDRITAKLEDGILRVEVAKMDKDYVEVKKVDIE